MDPLRQQTERDLTTQRIVNVGKPVSMPPSGSKSKAARAKGKASKQARKKNRGKK